MDTGFSRFSARPPRSSAAVNVQDSRVFDAMAGSYDDFEPWYEHLYEVLHAIVRSELAPSPPGRRPLRALDVGCGTGYQTAILADIGYETHGLDLSGALLRVARARLPGALLARADAVCLPYADASFDVVTCCGSTLSFVEEPARAIAEIARVLVPGGRLLLECEHRPSLDLGWALASSLSRHSLGYGVTAGSTLRALFARSRRGVVIDYPLPVTDGDARFVELRLFTRGELEVMLVASGMRTVKTCGIHMLTNAIPSTVLHRARIGQRTARLYRLLARLDDRARRSRLAQSIANSLVVLAEKHRGTER